MTANDSYRDVFRSETELFTDFEEIPNSELYVVYNNQGPVISSESIERVKNYIKKSKSKDLHYKKIPKM